MKIMTSRRGSGLRIVAAGCLVPLLAIAASARADERFWNNGLGGLFGNEANWDDGASGVPGFSDAAVFDVASIYTVEIAAERLTDRVLVRSGVVSLAVNGDFVYTALNPLPTTPGIAVGAEAGDVADMLLLDGAMDGNFADIGQAPGAFGRLTIREPHTHLFVEELLRVGNAGTGFFDVDSGGFARCGSSVIGQVAGSYGSARVSGTNTQWITRESLTVGKRGVGELLVESDADIRSVDAIIAQNIGSIGAATVTGDGSSWTIDGSLDVGMSGFGSLLIDRGALVTNHVFAAIGTLPDMPPGTGGHGSVTVRGYGSSWIVENHGFDGDLHVGFFGRGQLTVSTGGWVSVGGDLALGDNSEGGDLDLLVFELSRAGDFPGAAISVAGDVRSNVDDPRVRVDLLESYAPEAGDAFTLIDASAGTDIVAVETPPLPASLIWGVTQTSEIVRIEVAPDDCAYFPGEGEDCNGNGLVDLCDLVFEYSFDCNDNGIPDECDIAGGSSDDCNGNGVPDSCDVADGTSEDCNGNGTPDECEVVALLVQSSGSLSPIGNGSPQSFTIADAPEATGDVALLFEAGADLSSFSEYIDVDLNGTPLGRLFEVAGSTCGDPPDDQLLVIPADDFNAAVAGASDAVITMTASEDVDPTSCGGESFVGVEVSYAYRSPNDVNGNGTPDNCECLADIDEDGEVDLFDLLSLLYTWGPCDGCPPDVDNSGEVDFFDLLVLLITWGPCE